MIEKVDIPQNVKNTFFSKFGDEPILIKAPGRINLIGEHTDYNNGFVLPAATDQAIYLAVAKSKTNESTIVALDLEESYSFDIKDFGISKDHLWANYILGVIAEIHKGDYTLGNFNMVFSGDVPRGSGMSSSAALECGTCFSLNELFQLNMAKVDMVKMSQKAEHNYVGVMCGIMDQFASMMGKQDQAIMLDCKTLDFKYFPIKLENYIIVLCNSNVSHSLADSEYNTRRIQCEEGVTALRKAYIGVESLRDVTLQQLKEQQNNLTEVVFNRCKYIIEENMRVLSMTKAMENEQFDQVGDLLKTAHHAMQFEYEITCPEIDFIADFANKRDDVLGARMMGGGFGGCTINFVNIGSEDQFISELNEAYKATFSREITPIKVIISNGVSIVD
ncbi:MAG: galactokinase [Cyclobacteriaceae bacterium]|jgi:galactokinase